MKEGFIIVIGNHQWFQTFIKKHLVTVQDEDYAWFTQSLDLASDVLIELAKNGHEGRIQKKTFNH